MRPDVVLSCCRFDGRGVSAAQAARDLDVHENVLRKWVKEFGSDPVQVFPSHEARVIGGRALRARRSGPRVKSIGPRLVQRFSITSGGSTRPSDVIRRSDSSALLSSDVNSPPGIGRHKPLKPLRREMPSVPVDRCDRRVLTTIARGLRVQRVPGIPCALCFLGQRLATTRAHRAVGSRSCVGTWSAVIAHWAAAQRQAPSAIHFQPPIDHRNPVNKRR